MANKTISVDIVSDVMCPWCIVGYKRLERAMKAFPDVEFQVNWHPFELNPTMADGGQNLQEHLAQKYGSTKSQSERVRARLKELGDDLGFTFAFSDDSRIVNTYLAHQLLHEAAKHGLQHKVKLALFEAHFTDAKDVSDVDVLVEVAEACGLDAVTTRDVLLSGLHKDAVRASQGVWRDRGIHAVPSLVFEGKHLVTGAQDASTFEAVIKQIREASA